MSGRPWEAQLYVFYVSGKPLEASLYVFYVSGMPWEVRLYVFYVSGNAWEGFVFKQPNRPGGSAKEGPRVCVCVWAGGSGAELI